MSEENKVKLWKRIVQGLVVFIIPIIVVLPSLFYIRYYPEAIIPQYIGAVFGAWIVSEIAIRLSNRPKKEVKE